MKTLANGVDFKEIVQRASALTLQDQRRWGRMSVTEMMCHLTASYELPLGGRKAEPAPSFLPRTVVKWIALQSPLTWPKGLKTVPQVEQGKGGTLPVGFERDHEGLLTTLRRFSTV